MGFPLKSAMVLYIWVPFQGTMKLYHGVPFKGTTGFYIKAPFPLQEPWGLKPKSLRHSQECARDDPRTPPGMRGASSLGLGFL